MAFFLVCLVAAAFALGGYVWRSRRARPFHVLQFDNPIYRRTIEEADSLEFGNNGGIGSNSVNTLGAIPNDISPQVPAALQSRLVLNDAGDTSTPIAAAHLAAPDFYHPSNYAYDQPLPNQEVNARVTLASRR